MNILEIGITKSASGFVNFSPFVYKLKPAGFQLADYWVTIFGATDESNDKIIRVKHFTRASVNNYTSVDSLVDCQATEQSFFFDFENQDLYIHFEHDQNPLTDSYQYTISIGYTDSQGVVYIDNIEYLPIIKSIPPISQQASIVGYDKQAYVNGTVVLSNTNKIMDFLIKENVYGNDADLFYYDGTTLTPLASFYIEDYDFTLQSVSINVQDKRKAENPIIPENTFTGYPDMKDSFVGKPIYLAYGAIREIPCTPLNGEASGNVDFKACESLTSFGTVQVLIDDIWTTKTPTVSDLGTATFTLASADARETSGAVRKVKLVNPIGEVVSYASDVIKALNLRILGIPFVSSFYNLTEWTVEETALSPIGILIDKERPLNDWIKDIQGGANIGFRYEITPDGKRTIRVRDNYRASSVFIPKVSIFNNDLLPVKTDSDTVYAEVKVRYGKSYESGDILSVLNNDYKDHVIASYRQRKRLTVDTFLTSSAYADDRAANDALDFSEIRPNATLRIVGTEYLGLKIYEVITVELEQPDREYFGTREALILSIAPEGRTQTNILQVRLLDFVSTQKVIDGGDSLTEYNWYDSGDSTTDYDYIDGGSSE